MPDRVDVLSAPEAIAAVREHEAWAIIRRSTRTGDRDTVGVLGGSRSEVDSILDIPLETGTPAPGRTCDRLVAVPYSVEFRLWLEPAAVLLERAAARTSNSSLQRFLDLRADAFRTDDYYASELAWMDLAGTPMFFATNMYPRETADPEEVRRSVVELAHYADGIERRKDLDQRLREAGAIERDPQRLREKRPVEFAAAFRLRPSGLPARNAGGGGRRGAPRA